MATPFVIFQLQMNEQKYFFEDFHKLIDLFHSVGTFKKVELSKTMVCLLPIRWFYRLVIHTKVREGRKRLSKAEH